MKTYLGIILMTFGLLISSVSLHAQRAPHLRIPQASAIPTIDPGLAEDTTSSGVIAQMFLTLLEYDPKTFEPRPFFATSWKISEDGLTYTFQLRKDVFWTNGAPVTAQDVVAAVRRNISPETASPHALNLYVLKNAKAINQGTLKDVTQLGAKVLDDHTLEFNLEYPAGFFLSLATDKAYAPLPVAAIQKHGSDWTKPANIITNGPYLLDEWEPGNRMVLKKNPKFFDAETVKIEEIHYYIVPSNSTALAMYENNELDLVGMKYTSIPSADLERVKNDSQLSQEYMIEPIPCSYYFGFNTIRPPVDNPLVRRAISASIDRKAIVERITKGGQTPATTSVPVQVFGAARSEPGVGISYDPEQAKKWLAEAGYPDGKGFPEVIYMFNTSEGHAQIAQAIQAMLKRTLNIKVQLRNQEWKVYLRAVGQKDAPHMWRMGGCSTYLDANDTLESYHPTESENRMHWQNAEFEELITQGREVTDPEERKKIYRRAEQIVSREAAILVPIYYYTTQGLVKPWVNYVFRSMGGDPLRTWSWNP